MTECDLEAQLKGMIGVPDNKIGQWRSGCVTINSSDMSQAMPVI